MSSTTTKPQVTILPGSYEPDNLKQRVLASAVLDFSGSMFEHVNRLPIAWMRMVELLVRRTLDRLSVELACCAFATDVAYQDYAPVPFYLDRPLRFSETGFTSLGTALLTVVERTRQRREMLATEGIDSLRAVCVVISDGGATDRPFLEQAMEEIQAVEKRRQIEFIPLAPEADHCLLLEWIFKKKPILLDEVDFDVIFPALARSISEYSQSVPGSEPAARPMLENHLKRIRVQGK